MIKNLKPQDKKYLESLSVNYSGTLGNLTVRSWGDKAVLGPRTEEGKMDGRHADAFKQFGERYEELATLVLSFPGYEEGVKESVKQMVDVYKKFDRLHEGFVSDKEFAKKMISKEKVNFTPDEMKKINVFKTKVEYLKIKLENKAGFE